MVNYLKDPATGDVYLEGDNPIGYWTAEEWAAELKMRKDLLAHLQAQQAVVKTIPDQECLDHWNATMIQRPPEQIGLLETEIAEMEAVK